MPPPAVATSPGTRRRRLLVPAALGAATGVLAKVADGGPGWLADLGSYPAAWVLAVALLGWLASTTRLAAVGSAVFFAVMSLAYYGWAVVVLGFALRPVLVLLAVWLLLSATAVPLFAVGVRWATTHRGVLPGALLAGAAALAVAEGPLADDGVRPVQAVAGVLVALVVAGLLPRHGRTRAVSLVLLVPAVVVATAGLGLLRGAFPG